MPRILNLTLPVLILLSCVIVSAGSYRKAEVEPTLKKSLQSIVELSKDLHESSYTSNNIEIAKNLNLLEKQITKTKSLIIDGNQSTLYLKTLLADMEKSFIQARKQSAQEQKNTLQLGFKKVVRVSQSFNIGNFRTFYCTKNKELWIQRSWLVKNPIHPKSRCGVLVN